MKRFQQIVVSILGALLLIVVVQSFIPRNYTPDEQAPLVEVPCTGEPIKVDYPFAGGFLDPWACEQQCDDDKQRYVLYSNGKATQCETPPGCNDWGEDNGVECILPSEENDQ